MTRNGSNCFCRTGIRKHRLNMFVRSSKRRARVGECGGSGGGDVFANLCLGHVDGEVDSATCLDSY